MRIQQLYTRYAVPLILCITVMMVAINCYGEDLKGDPGAEAFLKHCMRCHTGILTGNDLQNTVLSTTSSLDKTVRRMEQQHTAPLTEKQIADLVELLKDREVKFRLEEAELMQDDSVDPVANDGVVVSAPDIYAQLYMKNCAACHTVGGGSSFGGDLAHTSGWTVERLRGDVSRMQARVGAMSAEQIDGLVELLQAPDRGPRLAAAGYKPPPVPALTHRLSPDEKIAKAARSRADAVRSKIASGKSGPRTSRHAPFGILFGSLVIAAAGSLGVYWFIKNGD